MDSHDEWTNALYGSRTLRISEHVVTHIISTPLYETFEDFKRG